MNRGLLILVLTCVIFSMFFIFSCAKKAPEPQEVPPTPIPEPTAVPTPIPEPTKTPEEIRALKLQEAEAQLSEIDIYFDFDKAMLSEQAKSTLASKAEYLVRNPEITVTIEGHCDERGSNEYNLGLGERRAASAKKYLVNFGVSSENISTVTYGEERPVCFEHNETCWSKNRRAHFTVNN